MGVTKNQESGIARILRQMREKVQSRPVHVAIAHAEALGAGERLQERIESEFNCVELWLNDYSPVMAYATLPSLMLRPLKQERNSKRQSVPSSIALSSG
jgi:fatty acid-binding protein DegV